MLWLAIGIISVILIIVFLTRRGSYDNLPPGPEGLPLLGNIKDLDTRCIHQCLTDLARKYGPVLYIKLFKRNIVVLSDANVLRKAFRSPEYRALMNNKPKGFYGTYLVYNHQDVLLGPYSDVTFKLKSLMHKGLQPAMNDSVIEMEAENLVKDFELTAGCDVDPQDIVRDAFGNLTAFLISGEHRDGDSKLMWDFVDSSNKMLDPSVETVLKNFPVLRLLPGKFSRFYKDALKCRDAIIQRFYEDFKASYNPGTNRGLVGTCLDIRATAIYGSEESWLEDDMIKASILDAIGAGLISTTNTLLGGILTLVHHQDVTIKMREEIYSVIGERNTPTAKDIARLHYCHSVLLEIFRYTSVVPLVNHFCSEEDVLFEDFTIPQNSMIWGNFWAAHHDETIYTDPWNFKPERFLDENGCIVSTEHKCRQSLFPFGLGARVCVGEDFAKVRLFVYIVALVQRFDILQPTDADLISCDPRLYHSGAVLQMDRFSCRFVPK